MHCKSNLLQDCRQLSAGTIATLTGAKLYADIDGWREDFCDWAKANLDSDWDSWGDAWERFKAYTREAFGILLSD